MPDLRLLDPSCRVLTLESLSFFLSSFFFIVFLIQGNNGPLHPKNKGEHERIDHESDKKLHSIGPDGVDMNWGHGELEGVAGRYPGHGKTKNDDTGVCGLWCYALSFIIWIKVIGGFHGMFESDIEYAKKNNKSDKDYIPLVQRSKPKRWMAEGEFFIQMGLPKMKMHREKPLSYGITYSLTPDSFPVNSLQYFMLIMILGLEYEDPGTVNQFGFHQHCYFNTIHFLFLFLF